MGWTIKLSVRGTGDSAIALPAHEAQLSITYNYGRYYRRSDVLGKDGLYSLDGRLAGECVESLATAIAVLGTEEMQRMAPHRLAARGKHWKNYAIDAIAILTRFSLCGSALKGELWKNNPESTLSTASTIASLQ
jgi:hypothetical protein